MPKTEAEVVSKKKPSISELEQQISELTEALKRERADSINLRARMEKDRASLGDFYKIVILREFLPAIDTLEKALKHIPKDLTGHDYVKGVQAVAKQFETVLLDLGIERIKTIGEKFDPRYHEAVHLDLPTGASAKEGDGKDYVEIVSEELQPGYILGGEVIRPAMVKVRRGKK